MQLNDFLSPDKPLVNYEYINSQMIDSFCEQLESAASTLIGGAKFKIEISIPFVKAGMETSGSDHNSIQKKMHFVLRELDRNNLITDGFPSSKSDPSAATFFFSFGSSTKYVLPKESLSKVGFERGAIVWLLKSEASDPESKTEGNIMYLLQAEDPGQEFREQGSVYSATQFLLEEIGVLRGERDPRDIPCYSDHRSAEMVLQTIGAKPIGRRKIATCYRCRAMSDNMYFEIDGITRRFNDVVAYPLFIASL